MASLNTRQKILIGIMIAVLCYAVYDFLLKGSDEISTPGIVQNNNTQVVANQSANTSMQNIRKIKDINQLSLNWERDPFFRKVDRKTSTSDSVVSNPLASYELRGVMGRGDNAMASINGEFYSVGDKLGEFEILRILENSVILKSGNKILTLRTKE